MQSCRRQLTGFKGRANHGSHRCGPDIVRVFPHVLQATINPADMAEPRLARSRKSASPSGSIADRRHVFRERLTCTDRRIGRTRPPMGPRGFHSGIRATGRVYRPRPCPLQDASEVPERTPRPTVRRLTAKYRLPATPWRCVRATGRCPKRAVRSAVRPGGLVGSSPARRVAGHPSSDPGFLRLGGARQGSCRLGHAANAV